MTRSAISPDSAYLLKGNWLFVPLLSQVELFWKVGSAAAVGADETSLLWSCCKPPLLLETTGNEFWDRFERKSIPLCTFCIHWELFGKVDAGLLNIMLDKSNGGNILPKLFWAAPNTDDEPINEEFSWDRASKAAPGFKLFSGVVLCNDICCCNGENQNP